MINCVNRRTYAFYIAKQQTSVVQSVIKSEIPNEHIHLYRPIKKLNVVRMRENSVQNIFGSFNLIKNKFEYRVQSKSHNHFFFFAEKTTGEARHSMIYCDSNYLPISVSCLQLQIVSVLLLGWLSVVDTTTTDISTPFSDWFFSFSERRAVFFLFLFCFLNEMRCHLWTAVKLIPIVFFFFFWQFEDTHVSYEQLRNLYMYIIFCCCSEIMNEKTKLPITYMTTWK